MMHGFIAAVELLPYVFLLTELLWMMDFILMRYINSSLIITKSPYKPQINHIGLFKKQRTVSKSVKLD